METTYYQVVAYRAYYPDVDNVIYTTFSRKEAFIKKAETIVTRKYDHVYVEQVRVSPTKETVIRTADEYE